MDEREELKEQLQWMIQKASRSLSAAKRHIRDGDYDFASSRAYYAAYYAVEAVLLTKHLAFSKHSAAIGAFNRQFVKTGIFPKDFSKLISRLFRERQTGDYEFDLSIEENDAREDIQIAESILEAIITYLTQEGFISADEQQ
jgi:uncharacterized protein (UPF0332 family)